MNVCIVSRIASVCIYLYLLPNSDGGGQRRADDESRGGPTKPLAQHNRAGRACADARDALDERSAHLEAGQVGAEAVRVEGRPQPAALLMEFATGGSRLAHVLHKQIRLPHAGARLPERRRRRAQHARVAVLRALSRPLRRAAALAVQAEGDVHDPRPGVRHAPHLRHVPPRSSVSELQETVYRHESGFWLPALCFAPTTNSFTKTIRLQRHSLC